MPYLFPISNCNAKPYKKKANRPLSIFIERNINRRLSWRIVVRKIRDVKRIHPNIIIFGNEFYFIIKENIPVFYFQCEKTNTMVNINHCLLDCRWSFKKRCTLFIGGFWACLGCTRKNCFLNCKIRSTCIKRHHVIDWVSLYFSYLMRQNNVIKKLRYGIKNRNRNTINTSIYNGVGKIIRDKNIVYVNHKHKTQMIAYARYKKRCRAAKKYRKDHLDSGLGGEVGNDLLRKVSG
jgi:hypothetical protein